MNGRPDACLVITAISMRLHRSCANDARPFFAHVRCPSFDRSGLHVPHQVFNVGEYRSSVVPGARNRGKSSRSAWTGAAPRAGSPDAGEIHPPSWSSAGLPSPIADFRRILTMLDDVLPVRIG